VREPETPESDEWCPLTIRIGRPRPNVTHWRLGTSGSTPRPSRTPFTDRRAEDGVTSDRPQVVTHAILSRRQRVSQEISAR
jgi:hypothetical protein